MKENVVRYLGYHTHPSKDSSARKLSDGRVLVEHDIQLRHTVIIAAVKRTNRSTDELIKRVNLVNPKGGYTYSHIYPQCVRLQKLGVLEYDSNTGRWGLAKDGLATFKNLEVQKYDFHK